ncbi:adenylate kinase family protein [Natranaeroarchaeum sulfidigenes]|uniref:adenylate kinase family protein n=1 Tax=Natranaeroarchaeum sulfidigenes TaxID=2784880 RepID=UPI001EE585AF|nr:adenylate kinase family protein [Natranaeroarchaeum sulfidigenes]
MRVAVTGTPGTGKTTATDLLETDLDVVHLNEAIREEDLYERVDEDRDSVVADLDAVTEWLGDRDDIVIDSHLAHHLDADRVVVLRCRPDVLEGRLIERGEGEASAAENAESEALDVILSEAVDAHGVESVYEIEATERTPEDVVLEIQAVVNGEREPSAGEVSYIDYL